MERESADHVIYKTAFIWVDGSCSGNPGSMGVGMHITSWEGVDHYAGGGWLGHGTNNEAEFYAVLSGLLIAEQLGYKYVKLYSDSQTVVYGINGVYAIKAPNLVPLAALVKTQLASFSGWEIVKIPRESNSNADAIAQSFTKKRKKNPSFNAWLRTEIRRLKDGNRTG